MTSKQFIKANFGVPSTRDRKCSSVFADRKGNIYSYGYHYPLLFKMGGLTFRNTTGYSNTTARHISWCWEFEAIDVELEGCNQYSWRNPNQARNVPFMLYNFGEYHNISEKSVLNSILRDLTSMKMRLMHEMDSKKRKDTHIFRELQRRCDRVAMDIDIVKGRV